MSLDNRLGPDSGALWERSLGIPTADGTHALGAALGRVLEAGDLLVLTGELGAGKTTFTQGLAEGLGVRAGVISPTFVLVRIHPNLPDGPRPGGPDLVHVDAYRLESAAEIDDIDLENTMDSSVTVVEWGRGRVEHLAESRLDIELHRPVGGPVAAAADTDVADADTDTDTGVDAVLDFDTDDDDEPRTIVFRGFGPRWATVPDVLAPALHDAPALHEAPAVYDAPALPEENN